MDSALALEEFSPTAAPLTSTRRGGPLSMLVAIAVGLVIMIIGFLAVAQVDPMEAGTAETTSFVLSVLASLPLLIWAFSAAPRTWMRIAIVAWLPLKAVLLVTAPAEDIALTTSDWSAFHDTGVLFSNYWAQGGSWILSGEILYLNGVEYLATTYLFGIPYLVFGQFGYVVVPWLGFIQLVCAVLAFDMLKRLKTDDMIAGLGMIYVLFCPAWLALTNQLYRDILLLLGLIIFLRGLIVLRRSFRLMPLLSVVVGVLMMAALREQYVPYLIAFTGLALAIGRIKAGIVVLLIPVLLISNAFFNNWFSSNEFGIGGGGILGRTELHVAETGTIAETASGSLVETYAPLTWYTLPVAIPFRIIISLVAPFPWTNTDVTLTEQTGRSVVYAGLHIGQALLHIALLVIAISVALRFRKEYPAIGREGLLSALFGAGLLLAAAVSWVGFNRNSVPAFLFFFPFYSAAGRYWSKTGAFVLALSVVVGLHVVYFVIR